MRVHAEGCDISTGSGTVAPESDSDGSVVEVAGSSSQSSQACTEPALVQFIHGQPPEYPHFLSCQSIQSTIHTAPEETKNPIQTLFRVMEAAGNSTFPLQNDGG